MSYELNKELCQLLIHMEGVLDRRISRSDALVLVVEEASKLAEERINVDADVARIERLEDDVEQLSEQIT